MSLRGLPDFHQPLPGDGFQLFYPFEGGEGLALVPDRLAVAARADGRPDFGLRLVRGASPDLPPAPYGLLDFRLRPAFPAEAALALLRPRDPQATVAPAVFASGFLRLNPLGDDHDLPAELRQPVPLAWDGLARARYTVKLSPTAATLVKQALAGAVLPLVAVAELEVQGVAPRLPLRVRFDPARLLGALAPPGNASRQVARADVVNFFRGPLASLPLDVAGPADTVPSWELAEVLTDWLRARLATVVPSPDPTGKPYLALASPQDIGTGTFEWDLSSPLVVARPFLLTLDPLDAARLLVRDAGLNAVVSQTEVPSLPTGTLSVSVNANLPAQRPAVLALGVTLHAPPRLPERPQAVIESADLLPPDDAATVQLRLSATEEPEYLVSTYVVLEVADGIKRFAGAELPGRGEHLILGPAAFPVDFIAIEADPELLVLATVHGTCRRPEAGAEVVQPFDLDLARPALALPLPRDTTGATLALEARARDGGASLALGPFPAAPLRLGLYSFREYGPHGIDVECRFDDATPLFALDLWPEGRPEADAEISVLHFTPAQPKRTWTWLARSPFAAGYRYRPHPAPGAAPAAWSAVQPPFQPLTIHTGAQPGGGP